MPLTRYILEIDPGAISEAWDWRGDMLIRVDYLYGRLLTEDGKRRVLCCEVCQRPHEVPINVVSSICAPCSEVCDCGLKMHEHEWVDGERVCEGEEV